MKHVFDAAFANPILHAAVTAGGAVLVCQQDERQRLCSLTLLRPGDRGQNPRILHRAAFRPGATVPAYGEPVICSERHALIWAADTSAPEEPERGDLLLFDLETGQAEGRIEICGAAAWNHRPRGPLTAWTGGPAGGVLEYWAGGLCAWQLDATALTLVPCGSCRWSTGGKGPLHLATDSCGSQFCFVERSLPGLRIVVGDLLNGQVLLDRTLATPESMRVTEHGGVMSEGRTLVLWNPWTERFVVCLERYPHSHEAFVVDPEQGMLSETWSLPFRLLGATPAGLIGAAPRGRQTAVSLVDWRGQRTAETTLEGEYGSGSSDLLVSPDGLTVALALSLPDFGVSADLQQRGTRLTVISVTKESPETQPGTARLCQLCHAPTRAGDRFCRHCGQPLDPTCDHCGAAWQTGDRFCGLCGQPRTEENRR